MRGMYMKLKVQNFAKLQSAEIVVDGITVIAGENNTGKTTIGKILFAIINSLSNLDSKIIEQQEEVIEKAANKIIWNYVEQTRDMHLEMNEVMAQEVDRSKFVNRMLAYYQALNNLETKSCKNEKGNKLKYDKLFEKLSIPAEEKSRLEKVIQEKRDSIIKLPADKISCEILSKYFGRVFHEQINALFDIEREAKITFEEGKQRADILFENNTCVKCQKDIMLFQKAIYIDNPFIVDCLDRDGELNETDMYLKDLLIHERKTSVMDGIIESVMMKEKMTDVMKIMNNVVGGDIIQKGNQKLFIQEKGCKEPVSFHGLSSGLKSFVIIKMLLEKGILEEDDVLILDEPEIHLHPQWQVVYAELIVLLQKYFDLKILVTTHSPYFLDAINLFSIKYQTDKAVNYYLAKNEKNAAIVESVTGNINRIYESMVTPVQQLETLRYELNNQ